MPRFSILLGSASEDFRQKKIEDMFDFLDSKKSAGDSIVTFANGISEMMLEMVMDNSMRQLSEGRHSELDSESTNKVVSTSVGGGASPTVTTTANGKSNPILLYICTLQPVADDEKSVWLGWEEIRRDVISHYQELAAECGIDMQVVFDSGSELVREEELGWEEVDNSDFKLMEKF